MTALPKILIAVCFYFAPSHCSEPITVEIICPGNIQAGSFSSFPFTGPAIDIGVEELQKTYADKFRVVLTYVFNRSLVTSADLVSEMDNLISEYYLRKRAPANATVFIYPGSSESLGIVKLAAGWDQFVMVGSFNDVSMRNKNFFPNVIQASPLMLRPMIQSCLSFIRHFNWTTIYVICDTASQIGPFNIDASKTLFNRLREASGTTVYYNTINTAVNSTFESVLRDIRHVARIVSFWGQASVLRNLMIAAAEANMTNGDYVYMAVSPFEYPTLTFGNLTWQNYDKFDEIVFQAYRSLYIVIPTPAGIESRRNREELFAELVNRSRRNYNYTYKAKDLPTPVALASYANLHIFGEIISQILDANEFIDLSSTSFIAKWVCNRSFVTPVGEIYFDEVGDRIVQFDVQQLNLTTRGYSSALRQNIPTLKLEYIQNIEWLIGRVPLDVPECGFSGVLGPCGIVPDQKDFLTLLISVVIAVLVVLLSGCLLVRKVISEMQLKNYSWDLKGAVQLVDSEYICSAVANKGAKPDEAKTFVFLSSQLAFYDGQPALATVVDTAPIELSMRPSRNLLLLTKSIQELSHNNINRFFGIARTPHCLFFIFDQNQRGSLEKMLSSQSIPLDWDAKLDLIDDLLQGLKTIHGSHVKFHGNLSCQTCLISKTFALKLTDIGIPRLLSYGFGIIFAHQQRSIQEMCHVAPELYSSSKSDGFGTVSADIFSSAIVCLELALESVLTPHQKSHESDLPSRIDATELPPWFKETMSSCVSTDPALRPSLKQIMTVIGKHLRHGGFVEKLLNRLSNYAGDLEEAIFLRTRELLSEREKCDMLLQRMLPGVIIDRLRRMENVEPEEFSCVTIQFSDIIGFVEFVTKSTAFNVFDFLNNSHGLFDEEITAHDVYKVETIADSYVIASGLPLRNGSKHAEEVCKTALCLRKVFETSPAAAGAGMHLRIGIHSGPCVAAVVGIRNPRYCLFGDTMNTASRMESHGEGLRIHLSPTTVDLILQVPELRCVARGPTAIKGKGYMNTFWLEPYLQ